MAEETQLGMNPQETLNAADEIRNLTEKMNTSFETLVEDQKRLQQSGIHTNFGEEFVQKLETYQQGDLADTTDTLGLAANNLENAARELDEYSNKG